MINIQPICTTDFTDPPMTAIPTLDTVRKLHQWLALQFPGDTNRQLDGLGAWMKLRIFLQLNPQNISAN